MWQAPSNGLLVKVIAQAGGQDGWILAKLQCQSILNAQAWSINDLLYGFRDIYLFLVGLSK